MNFLHCNLEPFIDENGDYGVVGWTRDGDVMSLSKETISAPKIHGQDQDIYDSPGEISVDESIRIYKELKNVIWPHPGRFDMEGVENIDLKNIHRSIVRYIANFIWIRDDRAYDLLADWVILSYLRPRYRFMPILMLDGTTVSGKSTLMEILQSIVYRGFLTSSFTSASLARIVDSCQATILCDETLDTVENKDRGGDIMNFLKSATSPNLPYVRAAPKSRREYDTFHLYTSVCISVKNSKDVEDVINRSIRIQLLTKPDSAEYEHYGDYDNDFGECYVPEGFFDMTAKQIRTELYKLKVALESGTLKDLPGLTEVTEKFRAALRTKDRHGQWMYGAMCGIENPPRVLNRLADIARTLVPVSILTGNAEPVMGIILDSANDAKEAAQNSMEANVLQAFVDVICERCGSGEFLKNSTMTRQQFIDVIGHITTRDIGMKLNDTMHANGELSGYDSIKTSTITYTLRTMGLTYTTGRGAGQRQTCMDPRTAGSFQQLDSLIRRYDPDSIDILTPARTREIYGRNDQIGQSGEIPVQSGDQTLYPDPDPLLHGDNGERERTEAPLLRRRLRIA